MSGFLGILPSLFGSVFGATSSMVNNALNRKQQAQINKLNYQMHQEDIASQYNMQDRANAFTLDMFNRSNAEYEARLQDQREYDSPAAQRQRLVDAGYNPYMQTNGSTTIPAAPSSGQGASGSVPSAIAAQSYVPPAESFGQGLSNGVDFVKQMAEILNIKQQTRKSAIESDILGIDSGFRKQFNEQQIARMIAATQELNNRSSNLKVDKSLKQLQLAFEHQTFGLRKSSVELANGVADSQMRLIKEQADYYSVMGEWLPPEAAARIRQLNSQVSLNFSQKDLNAALSRSNNAQAGYYDKQTALAEATRIEKMAGHSTAREYQKYQYTKAVLWLQEARAKVAAAKSDSEKKRLEEEALRSTPTWLRENGIVGQTLNHIATGMDIFATGVGAKYGLKKLNQKGTYTHQTRVHYNNEGKVIGSSETGTDVAYQ